MTSRTAASAVFGLLVLATVGAFFVTQRLKRSEPAVKRIAVPLYVSPNGDGRKDTARFSFDLPKGDDVTVSIVDSLGDEVRRIVDGRTLRRGTHTYTWNGRDSAGRVLPDGSYFVRVVLQDQGRAATGPRGIQLVTARPHPRLLSVTPARLPARGSSAATARSVAIRFAGPASPPPVFSVYRTDAGPPRLVARFAGARLSHVGRWDGRVGGRPAPAGTYAFAATVQNKALVAGSSPPLPPTRAAARRGTGITVSGPTAGAPLVPVRAGGVARVTLQGASGRLRWSLERLGARRPTSRGRGVAPTLRFAVPPRAATGVYLVRVHARQGSVVVPLAIRGRRVGPLLAVLPSISWQGLNPVDDDGDGFPDTLDDAPSVPLGRPFARGRPPVGFASQVAPLVRLLDRTHRRYDITTDLALASGQGPRLAGHRGVAIVGSERWVTPGLGAALRAYVRGGGRVAAFGGESLRRTVALARGRLVRPSPPRPASVFGERLASAPAGPGPLVATDDKVSLFAGTDGFLGPFGGEADVALAPPPGASALAAARPDGRGPAVVAYRLGRGELIRVGVERWADSLDDSEVAKVTETAWSLLSR